MVEVFWFWYFEYMFLAMNDLHDYAIEFLNGFHIVGKIRNKLIIRWIRRPLS